MSDSPRSGEWTRAPERFADALDDLKAAGSMILVIESNGGEASHVGCSRMLGAAEQADRRRLFVQTDAATSSRVAAAGRDDAADERVLHYDTTSRTAAAATTNQNVSPDGTTVSDLRELAGAANAEVESLAPPSGFDAGQLRVCVDAVGDIVADTDTAAVVNFVEKVGELVDEHDGMGHLHVDRNVPAFAAEALLPQVDAVVEVADDDDPRHRWHLPDESLSTEWLDLDN